ncbi:MAG TPA: AAA family ATPase [Chthoniobacteraceae bacterium]|jgi:DNA transposition AAA+ family ATPase|nr:AAA family ATPase [Chthoniobacteraceae bacterium]
MSPQIPILKPTRQTFGSLAEKTETSPDSAEPLIDLPGPETPEHRVRANTWGLPKDLVMRETKKYSPATCDALRWLYEWALHNNYSRTDIAKLIDYDATVITRALTGKYSGALDNITKSIQALREKAEIRQATHDFVPLSFHHSFNTYLDKARKYHRMALVTGPSWIGKSQAAKSYLWANNHGATKYLRMPSEFGMQAIWRRIAGACGVSRDQPVAVIKERIMGIDGYGGGALDDRHLLIVDEWEQVLWTYPEHGRVKTFEMFREIFDACGCGMAFIAAPSTEQQMEEGRLKVMLKKFGNRCPFRLRLDESHKLITPADLRAIAISFKVSLAPRKHPNLPSDDERECYDILRDRGNVGDLFLAFAAGRDMALKQRAIFTFDHVKLAWGAIYGRPETTEDRK